MSSLELKLRSYETKRRENNSFVASRMKPNNRNGYSAVTCPAYGGFKSALNAFPAPSRISGKSADDHRAFLVSVLSEAILLVETDACKGRQSMPLEEKEGHTLQ